MTRLRVGVVGAGMIAQVEHIPNLLALREKFESEYNVSPAASAALISVHFAGLGWVDAHNAGQIELRNQHEAAFKQSMAAVAWLMWEDGSGPLFSLGW